MAERQTIIYALVDPRDGDVRYIGKTNNPRIRLAAHLSLKRATYPFRCWVLSLLEQGITPAMATLEIVSGNTWEQAERWWISKAREDGVDLLNVADGGNQPHPSRENQIANGRRTVAARTSTPQKARLYKLKHEMSQLLRRGYGSPETRAKMRAAAQRHPHLLASWANV